MAKKMKTNILHFIAATCVGLGLSYQAAATEIDKNTAKMQAMDKITGRVSVINVPINGEIKFGSLSIVARACKTRPAEETPDNFAFVDITDVTQEGDVVNIFKGWMISSSPATHAVEHPIYDVWLLQCVDTEINPKELLSADVLNQRDNILMSGQSTNSITAELSASDDSDPTPITEMPAEQHFENQPAEMTTEFSFDEDEDIMPNDNYLSDNIELDEDQIGTQNQN